MAGQEVESFCFSKCTRKLGWDSGKRADCRERTACKEFLQFYKSFLSRPSNLLKRFWSKVHKSNGCWEWTAPKANGYGMIRVLRGELQAHRVSWMLHYGYIREDLLVCHKCDNPKCVRPDHLFAGTIKDNAADAKRKGRTLVRAMRNPNRKITLADANTIRSLRLSGSKTKDLAIRYGVCADHISRICHYKKWRWINEREC